MALQSIELNTRIHIDKPHRKFIKCFEFAVQSIRGREWLQKNSSTLLKDLTNYGALHFRGLNFDQSELSELLSFTQINQNLDYLGGTSPRSEVLNNVYESTSAPPKCVLTQHQELSYNRTWPRFIYFYCQNIECTGGETPISDMRGFTKKLSPKLVETFKNNEIQYSRAFVPGLGPSWQSCFKTKDSKEVEKICSKKNVDWEWRFGKKILLTTHSAQSFAHHPITQEELWFNQVNGANWYSEKKGEVAPQLTQLLPGLPFFASILLKNLPPKFLPYRATFTNGKLIAHEFLAEINNKLESQKVSIPWQKSDLLILDNMQTSHGRNAFSGKRNILVGFT